MLNAPCWGSSAVNVRFCDYAANSRIRTGPLPAPGPIKKGRGLAALPFFSDPATAYFLTGVWPLGKKVLATIFAVCPRVAAASGRK